MTSKKSTARRSHEERGPDLISESRAEIESPGPFSSDRAQAQKAVDNGSDSVNAGPFLLTLISAVGLALLATVIIAPIAAVAVAAFGLHFPFPRIFDRTIMVALFAAILLFAQRLRLFDLVIQGFKDARVGVMQASGGLALAGAAMALLFVLATFAGGNIRASAIVFSVFRFLPAAILIAVIEEGFFRAFLLGGLKYELGTIGAVFVSSAIFAVVHVMRSPARFYLTKFDPTAGAVTLVSYGERIVHAEAGPPLFGLFLLGVVLGEAFVISRRVYVSLGLHTGFVLGAKTWRLAISGSVPGWLAGAGRVPLIAAPAAWGLSLLILALLPLCITPTRSTLPTASSKEPLSNATEKRSVDN